MIFVFGATGKVGRALVPTLLDAGAAVRALTRDPAKAHIDPRAEVVQAASTPRTCPRCSTARTASSC